LHNYAAMAIMLMDEKNFEWTLVWVVSKKNWKTFLVVRVW
jgi:hypothetical protein